MAFLIEEDAQQSARAFCVRVVCGRRRISEVQGSTFEGCFIRALSESKGGVL